MESLRQQYRPADIRLLYVGESPPANGAFFYAGRTMMETFTRQVYEAVSGLTFADDQAFLRYFCESGAFLDDLSAIPVDQLRLTELPQTI